MLPYPEFQKQFYDQLLLSQYDPPEKRQQDQRRNLERLIRFARRNVPFYKDRLDVLFTARDKIDWSRWNEVPITRRNDIVDSGHLMVPAHLPPTHGRVFVSQTSGSSGPAITVKTSLYANLLHAATGYRGDQWHGIDCSKDLVMWYGNDPNYAPLDRPVISKGWGAPWENVGNEGRKILYSREIPYEDILGALHRLGPVYFYARSAAAHSVALEALSREIALPLHGLVTFGTGASDTQRGDIQKAFGCNTISPYSSKEGMLMAFQCPSGNHYHVNEETTLLELLSDKAGEVVLGGVGRVTVTPVFNYAMPLIRYDHEDLAVRGGACSCGRTLATIDTIVGRQMHLFRFPSGRRVSLSLPPDLLRSFGADFWQVAQVAPLRLEVRYVRHKGGDVGSQQPLTDALRQRTDPNIEVVFKEVADLERSATGKFVEFVCELPRQDQPGKTP